VYVLFSGPVFFGLSSLINFARMIEFDLQGKIWSISTEKDPIHRDFPVYPMSDENVSLLGRGTFRPTSKEKLVGKRTMFDLNGNFRPDMVSLGMVIMYYPIQLHAYLESWLCYRCGFTYLFVNSRMLDSNFHHGFGRFDEI
jgi:hypothetical protein